ncbi:MAG: hypothetical protein WBV74_06790 [Pseudonocardiaceae bacterium]
MTDQKVGNPPELVALCRENEDRVVGYVPDRNGLGVGAYTFESLDSAEWILGYSGIYPRR